MKSEDLICTKHEEILSICREQLEILPPETEAPEEYCSVYEAFRDIMKEAESAMESGQRMEYRLMAYSLAIKSLGFVRKKEDGGNA